MSQILLTPVTKPISSEIGDSSPLRPGEVPTTAQEGFIPHSPLYRFTHAQYERMAEAGILTGDDHVELLEGVIVRKMTKHTPHIVATGLVQDALTSAVSTGWFVQIQDPFVTVDSEPEPDALVIRGRRRDYSQRKPGASDLGLVVEVSDTSLSEDRTLKYGIYARAGIPAYWIVNLPERQLEVYGLPTGPCDNPEFTAQAALGPDQDVELVLDGNAVARIRVAELLP